MRCASCGQESPAGFRFCGNCGAPLTEAPPREVRKVVTVVFCDLTGSTALGDATDPEALRATMRRYYEQMRAILERHGGSVEKFIGDAVMAVFGVPVAHEDDALRAVRAAWEMRLAVPALGLQARIGVNTGEVVAGEGDALVTGDAVNVAARLEQAAEPGEVLIGSETRRLVRDAVVAEPTAVTAKGKAVPVEAFRLLELDAEAAAVARRLDTPLVGRHGELEQLRHAFERAVREQRCHLFTLLGPAGVGKSRLVAEFLATVDAHVVTGRCLDYGEGITFWPVVSVLKQLGERAGATLGRLVGGASSSNELFWAVRTQLEEVAVERPLVVVFDDIQWGEETFLDLVDHVADLSRGSPLLLLCVARPDLLDKRPTWGGGKLNATTVLLEPLTDAECDELIDAHGGVAPQTKARILAAADGNPLFVEEMVALARENGDVRVPPTVQALLQARLDQLGHDERSVMERGAVEGQVFHRNAVAELTRSPDVEPHLVGLVRKELIRPAPPAFTGDLAFRFRHLLIRDAAYDGLPKEIRAELHTRFAEWLERHGSELVELDEVLGYHLEQAARYRRELGPSDEELEGAAGRHLASAGSRALGRCDVQGAANLLRRALALLPEGDPLRPGALVDQLTALDEAGLRDEQRDLSSVVEQHADPALAMHGRIARVVHGLAAEPEGAVGEADAVVEEALEVFAEAGDELGLAHAYHLAAWMSWLQSRAVPTVAALEPMLEHARRADALGLVGQGTLMMIGPLTRGPFTPGEIRERLQALRSQDSALARHAVMTIEGHLAHLDGRLDDAFELGTRAARIAEELGMPLLRAIVTQVRAELLRTAGRLDESVDAFGEALERLDAMGHTSFRSTALINLAQTLYERGDVDEAERLAIEGEELGAAEDVINFAWGRELRARIATGRGEAATAEQLAREALEYVYRTDFPGMHASAHDALARALAAAGRREEARREAARALELWEHFGFTFETERARALEA